MPQLISAGNKLFRVNPRENRVEISYNGGILWVGRSRMGKMFGKLKDLLFFHGRIFALTETGIWFSENEAATWGRKGSGKLVQSFIALLDGGNDLLALSEDGCMYRSYNEGACWARRG